jgi:hypothetical protein
VPGGSLTTVSEPDVRPEDGGLPRTGDEAVDAAVDRLRSLDPDAPPAEQLPVLVGVHEALQQRLAAAAE